MFGKAAAKGHILFDSTIASKPSFSFGKKHSKERVVNTKNLSDFLCRESPGVGHYHHSDISNTISHHQETN
jgi:hypothetical protein